MRPGPVYKQVFSQLTPPRPRPAPSEYKRRIKAAEKEKADAAKAAEKVSPACL